MAEEFLDTPRCRISALHLEDAGELQALTDASVTSHIHFLPEPFTIEDAQALIASAIHGHRFLGIWAKDGQRLVGVVGVHPRRGADMEIGYWLGSAARGRGLATEAVAAVVAMLAHRRPLPRIVAECPPDNVRSWALLDRIGFTPSGERGERPGRLLFCWQQQSPYRIDVC